MERCWFVLKQKNYPPPHGNIGPIQLGHLIPDLKHLDQVINNDPGPYPFPAHMVVYPSVLENLRWSVSRSREADTSVGAQLPIPQTAGLVNAGGEIRIAFQKSVSNFWHFKKLESQFIQPTEAYIKDSLQTDIVQRYIKRHKILGSWSIFMITGLAVARSASATQTDGKGSKIHGGPEVSVAGLLDTNLKGAFSQSKDTSTSFDNASDFVWAIKVMAISKSVLSSEWKYETYVKGATYGVEDDEDVKEKLVEDGFLPELIYETEEEDVFVLPNE